MDRRQFIAAAAAPVIAVAGQAAGQTFGGDSKGKQYGHSGISRTAMTRIGSMTIGELLAFHEKELEEEYVSIWNNRGIDHEYGGLSRRWDKDGKFTTDEKDLYDVGRGLWVFSHLYNYFGKREQHLTAARLCWEFIRDHHYDKTTGYWFAKVSRDGSTVIEGPYDIYGDMYVVLGLSEYWKAVDQPELLDIAVTTAHGITKRIVAAEYQHIKAHKDGFQPGTKILGTWQHFLNALTCLARENDDHGIEMTARMCVRNIMERHWRPDTEVFMEYLDDKFEPYPPGIDGELRKVSSWHCVQSCWMCMDESLRTGDRHTFLEAVERGRMTLERCWIDDEDKGLIGLDYPEQDVRESSDTPAWGRLDDTLVFLLLVIEHTGAEWALSWYDRVFSLAYRHPEKFSRTGLLHHPRRLFLSIHMLERIVERQGKTSSFLTS